MMETDGSDTDCDGVKQNIKKFTSVLSGYTCPEQMEKEIEGGNQLTQVQVEVAGVCA